jgi:transcriptional regulator with XRE-family HTH domain
MQGAFRETLQSEFAARRAKNARYSLRAFASFLNADHSSVAQILRGLRPIPAVRIRLWARKLGYGSEEAAVFIAAEHVASTSGSGRVEQLRHWTSEALAVIRDPVHFEIVKLTREQGFSSDTRWVAARADASADQVNMALTRLLRLGLVTATNDGVWRDLSGLEPLTQERFRKLALDRVREFAARDGVSLGNKERKAKYG